MSTFLELCQMAARESGTISGVQPATTVDQSGRLAKVCHWVNQAWNRIQLHREHWSWMRKEFSAPTIAGIATYTPAGWSINDLARWLVDQNSSGYLPVTLYKTATGVVDEGEIHQIPYEEWRSKYGRGSQTNNRPIEYSIAPDNSFLLGPIPDDIYTVRGEYFRSPQVFAADADIPEGLPSHFHDIIAWRAVLLLAEHDEAVTQIATAASNYQSLLSTLERDTLPKVSLGVTALA